MVFANWYLSYNITFIQWDSSMLKKKAKEEALLNYQQGKRLVEAGEMTEGAKRLFSAQQYFKQANEPAILADIYRLLGEVFFTKGSYIDSRNYYKKAFSAFKGFNNKIGMADCYDQIALSFLIQEELAHASDYQQRALALRKETPDKKGQARALKNLAVIVYKKDNAIEKALRLLEEALALAQKSKDPQLVVNIALNHSKIASKKGDYIVAMKSFVIARRVSKKFAIKLSREDEKDFGTLLLNLGLQKYDENELEESLEYLKKAAAILKSLDDPLVTSVLKTISKIELLLK